MKFPASFTLLVLSLQLLQLSAQEKSAAENDGSASAQLADYPRPMLMRPTWINLNGKWDFALAPKDAISSPPKKWAGKVSVPITADAAPVTGLDETKRIWYRTQFALPKLESGQHLLLHCNGVATETVITVNGVLLNMHQGANTPFHADITGALTEAPNQEIAIAAWSPDPESQITGITREVWLEVIPRSRISSIEIDADPETGKVSLHANIWGQANFRTLEIRVLDGEKEIATGSAYYHYKNGGYGIDFTIPEPQLWSPESPKLYGLRVRLANEDKTTHDDVTSYFALKKIENITADKTTRFALNGKPTFLLAIDDPVSNAGLSDKALRSKLEAIKAKGYNTIRKLNGMDSPRFYHWADRVGLLVWQELPAVSKEQKATKPHQESASLLKARYFTHPSITIWPSDYFDDAENIYTAAMLTQAEPLAGKARVAPAIDGNPSTKKQAINKLKKEGFSAVLFSGEADK